MAEFPSLNDQLRSMTNREFPNYFPVPSLAESSGFGILCFCSPKSVKKQSLLRKVIPWSSSSQADSDTGCSPNLKSFGYLFDYCKDNPDEAEVKLKEEPVCIHGQASGSQLSGGVEVGVEGCPGGYGGSASFQNKNILDLGKIVKISVPYKELSCWMNRFTTQNSPELSSVAKKGHLFVVYEVLTAEHLEIEAEENSNIEGNVGTTEQNGGVKGTGSWTRKKDCRLSRPNSMGRYPFAYKCGRVRVKKCKKLLDLVGLDAFYEPFQVKDQNEPITSDQSRKYIELLKANYKLKLLAETYVQCYCKTSLIEV